MPETTALDLTNLSRKEARVRSSLLTVSTITVEVDVRNALDLNAKTFPVSAQLEFSCSQPGAKTTIDFINAGIDSLQVNGKSLDPDVYAGKAKIVIPDLASNNVVTIKGRARYSSSGEGMHRYRDPADGNIYLYTQYEPSDARRVFPSFEQPDLKARYSFSLVGPAGWKFLSNGAVKFSESLEDGSQRVVFEETKPMSSYITAFVAGPYREFTDHHLGIPLALYCRESLVHNFQPEKLFRWTKLGLDFFEEYFNFPYPWGKYDQAFVPEYNLGAMENPGLVTFNDRLVFEPGATAAEWESLANVLMHEMSHMWFGDLVTMRWWNDLWLKESFADYMGSLALVEAVPEFNDAWVSFAIRRKAWAYEQDQLPTTHPIVADIPDVEAAKQNFDGITYAKGASVLKQLVAFVGADDFMTAARKYIQKHAWGNAQLEDFLAALSEVSGQDTGMWAQQWLHSCGVSTLATTEDSQLTQVGVDPCSHQPIKRPHVTQVGYFDATSKPYKRIATIPVSVATSTPIEPPLPQEKKVLELINDGDLTYAKTQFDENSLSFALSGLTDDPLSNAVMYASLWNLVRDAQLTAPEYIAAALAAYPNLTPVTLSSAVLTNVVTATETFVPRSKKAELADTIIASLLPQLEGLGAERAMTASIAVMASARYSSGADAWLMRFLQSPAGATIDGIPNTDQLRWQAALALTTRGKLNERDLTGLRGDRTNTAVEVGFAQAVAAIPDAYSKAEAWDRIFSGNLSNEILTATIRGFRIGSAEVLSDFDQRYFDWIEMAWAQHSIGMATRMVAGLFPGDVDVTDGDANTHRVIVGARRWLAEAHQASPALRRIVVERTDLAERALRAQALVD